MARILLCDTSSDEDEIENIDYNNVMIQQRSRRQIRPRINFVLGQVSSFKQRFRIAPMTADTILNIIGPIIKHRTKRNHALDPRQQLLIALHFFGSGCQYHCVGDMHGVHASTVCRIINRVTTAVIQTLFISQVGWPNTNILSIPLAFSCIAGFPRVAG